MSASAAVFTHLAASGYTSTQMRVEYGSFLVAVPIALAAGLISFLSPCVLPLVPGYLSYVTGLTGVDLGDQSFDEAARAKRGRMILGALLFVLGFSVVFVLLETFAGWSGGFLLGHKRTIQIVLGSLTILMGLSFAGVVPGVISRVFNREARFHKDPRVGLAGAPLLGVLFGLGWTPCMGPTLTAVSSLSLDSGNVGRSMLIGVAYCLGWVCRSSSRRRVPQGDGSVRLREAPLPGGDADRRRHARRHRRPAGHRPVERPGELAAGPGRRVRVPDLEPRLKMASPTEEMDAQSLTTAPREDSGESSVTLPRLSGWQLARWAWRQLTSMRVALILLFMLSLAAIPGSLLPQRSANTDPALVTDWIDSHKTVGPLLDHCSSSPCTSRCGSPRSTCCCSSR